MPPKPGKHIKPMMSVSDNKHQRHSQRVSLNINMTLTVEPDEALQLADAIESSTRPEGDIGEIYDLVVATVATTPRKTKLIVENFRFQAEQANLQREFGRRFR